MRTHCRCGQKLRWGTNPVTGKRQPFDHDPDPNGNRTLDEFGNIYALKNGTVPMGQTGPYLPHHASCPFADEFRRR
jgi:hypothetical protein